MLEMLAQELLKKTLSYWPFEIDISDGKPIPEIQGFKSGNLSNAWDVAEEKAKGDEWDEIAVWTIFGLLHRIAKTDFNKRQYKIRPELINLSEFKVELLEALQYEGYEDMLSVYTRSNP